MIGETPVREGKVEGLLAGGATDVLVDRGWAVGTAGRAGGDPGVQVERRAWAPEDLDGAFIWRRVVHDPVSARRSRARLAPEAFW